jgi:hypothetical protein
MHRLVICIGLFKSLLVVVHTPLSGGAVSLAALFFFCLPALFFFCAPPEGGAGSSWIKRGFSHSLRPGFFVLCAVDNGNDVLYMASAILQHCCGFHPCPMHPQKIAPLFDYFRANMERGADQVDLTPHPPVW